MAAATLGGAPQRRAVRAQESPNRRLGPPSPALRSFRGGAIPGRHMQRKSSSMSRLGVSKHGRGMRSAYADFQPYEDDSEMTEAMWVANTLASLAR